MLWAVLVEEKRRKNANVSKSAWEYHCPSGKTQWSFLQYIYPL